MWSRFLASIDKQAQPFAISGITTTRFSCTEAKALKAEYIDKKLTQNLRYILVP